jgi:hypothetical protein
MNMMAAGGWIPQDQLGQNIQGQPNPFASLSSNQPWSNDPNQQAQDGTGARPAAGRAPIPSPINDPANNRPPAKEEKLV